MKLCQILHDELVSQMTYARIRKFRKKIYTPILNDLGKAKLKGGKYITLLSINSLGKTNPS